MLERNSPATACRRIAATTRRPTTSARMSEPWASRMNFWIRMFWSSPWKASITHRADRRALVEQLRGARADADVELERVQHLDRMAAPPGRLHQGPRAVQLLVARQDDDTHTWSSVRALQQVFPADVHDEIALNGL